MRSDRGGAAADHPAVMAGPVADDDKRLHARALCMSGVLIVLMQEAAQQSANACFSTDIADKACSYL